MKDFVEYIAKQFVGYPGELVVSELVGKHTVILELRCNARDVGRVIGRNGRTIGAMRSLLTALAGKQGRRAVLEVVG